MWNASAGIRCAVGGSRNGATTRLARNEAPSEGLFFSNWPEPCTCWCLTLGQQEVLQAWSFSSKCSTPACFGSAGPGPDAFTPSYGSVHSAIAACASSRNRFNIRSFRLRWDLGDQRVRCVRPTGIHVRAARCLVRPSRYVVLLAANFGRGVMSFDFCTGASLG